MPVQIIDLPRTSAAIKELATELVRYIKGEITNTQSRVDWTWQNISLLDSFFVDRGCHRNFTASDAGPGIFMGLHRVYSVSRYAPRRGVGTRYKI